MFHFYDPCQRQTISNILAFSRDVEIKRAEVGSVTYGKTKERPHNFQHVLRLICYGRFYSF